MRLFQNLAGVVLNLRKRASPGQHLGAAIAVEAISGIHPTVA
jgi:hypothetical protein